MDDHPHQCIHCSVTSCRHLDERKKTCCLNNITISPTPMAHTGNAADESMCRDYLKK